jgi:imidazolonepropionase-like amidohydrolase
MKRITLLILLLTSSLAIANFYVPGKKQDHPILLKGGDLYTVSNGILEHTDLLFENGRITQIARDIAAPANAEVIDATGKRIYPGLIDGASTIGLVEIDESRATRDKNEVGDITPEVQTHIAYNPDSEIIPTVRSNGVLLALVAPEGGTISGRSSLFNLDGWTKEDAMEKINVGLHIRWPAVAISTAWWVEKSPEEQKKEMSESRLKLRDAFESARAYAKARKAGTLAATDLRWEAMAPVFDKQLTVFISADDMRQIQEAVAFALEQDIKIVIVGGREAYRVAPLLKEHNIPVIIGRVNLLPMREDDDYDASYRLPALLAQAGVKFSFSYSMSTWSSRSLPFQAAHAVAFGLDPAIALRSLTLTTAEILGVDKDLGSLEVGKKATLVVSDGDILDPITQRVVHAFIGGRKVDLNNKQKQLYEKYRAKVYPEK